MQSPTQEEVREALGRILASKTFEKSERARDLLRYIVEQDLAGKASRLKGFVIGVDVLGKDAGFDAASDPIVRVHMGRLRDLLASYRGSEGASDGLLIEIPKGQYRPQYRRQQVSAKPEKVSATGQTFDGIEPFGGNALSASSGGETPSDPAAVYTRAPNSAAAGARPEKGFRFRTHLRLYWGALGLLFAMLAGLAIVVLKDRQSPGSTAEQTSLPADFPRIHILMEEGDAVVAEFAEKLGTHLSKFDTVLTLSPRLLDGTAPTGRDTLDYAIRLRTASTTAPGGAINVKAELVNLSDGVVLRAEEYPADVWSTPEIRELAATKLTNIATPEGVIYADLQKRGVENRTVSCLLLVKAYYDLRNRARFERAHECTSAISKAPKPPGLIVAHLGGLMAEDIARQYGVVPVSGDRRTGLMAALAVALRGVDLVPASARAAREIGYIHSWLGEFRQMSDWFGRAFELNPIDTSVAASHGYGLVMNSRYAEASEIFGHVIAAMPRHPTWWDFYHAIALLMDGKPAEATSAAVPLGLAKRNAFYAAVNISLALQNGDRKKAEELAGRFREDFPEWLADLPGELANRHFPDDLMNRLLTDLGVAGLR